MRRYRLKDVKKTEGPQLRRKKKVIIQNIKIVKLKIKLTKKKQK